MKFRVRVPLWALFLSLAAALVWGLATQLSARLPRVFHARTTAASQILAGEIRDIYRLNTVQYIYKTVFPHDYLEPDLSIDDILATLRRGGGSTDTLLSPRERAHLEAWNLARELGFRMTRGRQDFVVLTAIVRGGFDLSGWNETNPGVHLHVAPGKPVRVRLPQPVITEVIIEDPTRETYPYPDIALTPERLRRLAVFLDSRIRDRVLNQGILQSAVATTQTFIRRILAQAGYGEAVFESP